MTDPRLELAWGETRARLAGFIGRRVSNPTDAEDVLQEVMLRIHRHDDEMDRFEHLTAWIYQVARSGVVDFYRRRAARPEHPAGTATEVIEGQPTSSPDRAVSSSDRAVPEDLRAELAPCLTPLLGRMREKHREALQLIELDGLTQAATARRLGLSNSGMKTRVQRARVELRELLLECCHVELAQGGGIAAYEARPGSCAACGRRTA